jgi:hypothetical protein
MLIIWTVSRTSSFAHNNNTLKLCSHTKPAPQNPQLPAAGSMAYLQASPSWTPIRIVISLSVGASGLLSGLEVVVSSPLLMTYEAVATMAYHDERALIGAYPTYEGKGRTIQ